ncbi:hypothetical protein [Croceicoccus sp. BE223]|uniref:hypothetical protein n=1 Tax=Croceicoccus sp. BE223 TaxID=2817716 RepID=UPI00285740A3|nr:hypothetical protein [Croceicoccus sp. BE223]MDR7102929.1 hypothetical protein [Croceicoccus sp. BE223]
MDRWRAAAEGIGHTLRRHGVWLARLAILVAVVLAVHWLSGFMPGYSRPSPEPPGFGDRELYQAIAAQMAAGRGYYETAIALQNAHGYPVMPWFTVRAPTFAFLTANLGDELSAWLARGLLVAAALAWSIALHRARFHPLEVIAAFTAILAGGFMAFYVTFLNHETWASLFMALGFALWRPSREGGAVVCFAIACLFREFAVIALLLGLAIAVIGGGRSRIGLWLGALALVAAFYGWHTLNVIDARGGAGLTSQGWSGRIGVTGTMFTYVANSIYRAVGVGAGGLLMLATMLGWLGAGPLAWRVVPVTLGWLVVIAVFSRPDNIYWSNLIVVWFPVGLVLFPRFVAFAATGRGLTGVRSAA